jgi:hypothetical protein
MQAFIDQATALDVSITFKDEVFTEKSIDTPRVDISIYIRSHTNTMMDMLMTFKEQSSEQHVDKIVQEIYEAADQTASFHPNHNITVSSSKPIITPRNHSPM